MLAFSILSSLAAVGALTLAAFLLARRRAAGARPLGLGVDLVEVADVAAALASGRAERYLRLVYAPSERLDCTTPSGIEPSRLAARFAAKEAVRKAIGGEALRLPWTSIRVEHGPEGEPLVRLDEPAASIAKRQGLERFALSLTHEPEYAAAVVVATR